VGGCAVAFGVRYGERFAATADSAGSNAKQKGPPSMKERAMLAP
jgi:hypothetical protein